MFVCARARVCVRACVCLCVSVCLWVRVSCVACVCARVWCVCIVRVGAYTGSKRQVSRNEPPTPTSTIMAYRAHTFRHTDLLLSCSSRSAGSRSLSVVCVSVAVQPSSHECMHGCAQRLNKRPHLCICNNYECTTRMGCLMPALHTRLTNISPVVVGEKAVSAICMLHTLPALRTLLSAATVPRTPRTSYTADFGSVPLHILS